MVEGLGWEQFHINDARTESIIKQLKPIIEKDDGEVDVFQNMISVHIFEGYDDINRVKLSERFIEVDADTASEIKELLNYAY